VENTATQNGRLRFQAQVTSVAEHGALYVSGLPRSVLARANDFVGVDNFYYTRTRVGIGMTLNVLRKE
jgi:hypothetical protein